MSAQTVAWLRERLRGWERQDSKEEKWVKTGLEAVDWLLPHGAIRKPGLVEWIAAGWGAGEATLALELARQACGESGWLLVVDSQGEFYPPAAAGRGIALERLIVVRPSGAEDLLWTLDQGLRSRGIAALLAWPGRIDPLAYRRLALAAEASGVLGIFCFGGRAATAAGINPAARVGDLLPMTESTREREFAGCGMVSRPCYGADGNPSDTKEPSGGREFEPSFADVRFFVEPIPLEASETRSLTRRLRIRLLRCRGGGDGGFVDVEIGVSIDGSVYEGHASSDQPPASGGVYPRRLANNPSLIKDIESTGRSQAWENSFDADCGHEASLVHLVPELARAAAPAFSAGA